MTNAQLIFSLAIGTALIATGFALAQGGITDWGLFWTGAIISALTLTAHLRQQDITPPRHVPQLLPVSIRVDR